MQTSEYVKGSRSASITSTRSSGPSLPTPFTLSFILADYSSGYIEDHMSGYYPADPDLSKGFELSIGPDKQYEYFVVMRYRQFTHEAWRNNYDWSQYFIEVGARYCGIGPIAKVFYPVFGGGVGFTKIHLRNAYSKNPYGFGLYFEGGIELRLAKGISIGGLAEYSTYRLLYKTGNPYDEVETLGNDSKLYLMALVSISFNRGR